MAYEYIIGERLDGVALITLNRPDKLNALSFPLMEEVDRALTGYEQDDDIAPFRPAPTSMKWRGFLRRSWPGAATRAAISAGISRATQSR